MVSLDLTEREWRLVECLLYFQLYSGTILESTKYDRIHCINAVQCTVLYFWSGIQ